MANFAPLKNYIFKNIQRVIAKHEMKSPFIDVGGGTGDVSEFMAKQGFHGKYIDFSKDSFAIASLRLKDHKVETKHMNFLDEKSKYNLLLCLDVLEHIEDDVKFIRKFRSILYANGYIILIVPINKKEWRWDDEYYGHYRRYDPENLKNLFRENRFEFIESRGVTFPVFWALRRMYTRMKSKPDIFSEKEDVTKKSARRNAWDFGFLSKFLSINFFWYPIFLIQDIFNKTSFGHELLFVFKKRSVNE